MNVGINSNTSNRLSPKGKPADIKTVKNGVRRSSTRVYYINSKNNNKRKKNLHWKQIKVTTKTTAESALIDTQKSARTEQKYNKFTIVQLISLLVKKISDLIFHIDTNDAPYNSCSVICWTS